MSRICFVLIFGVLLDVFFFIAGSPIYADSLWQRRTTINYNLFDDNKGKRVGDIVTVLVSEETSMDGEELSETDNEGGHSGEISNDSFLNGIRSNLLNDRNVKFTERAGNKYSTDFQQNFSGEGSYDSSRRIEMTLTAVIVDVLDNGNLLLEGKREVMVNKEKYNLKLTGTARPIDIALDNTIMSSQMSNVKFALEGKGWLTRAGKKGWYNRLKDIFMPF